MEQSPELQNFTHNVAWLRKTHGLSKKEMARIMGIGVGSLNKLERGELPPNLGVAVLYALSRRFGIATSDLFSHQLGE